MGGSTPGLCEEDFGGAVFNSARALARLGQPVRLISARGNDAPGAAVAGEADALGILNTPILIPEARTARYLAIFDEAGGLVAAIADMGIYEQVTPAMIEAAWQTALHQMPSAVIVDANLPREAITTLASLCQRANLPLYGLGVSAAKSARFADSLSQFKGLCMNRAEATVLTDCDEPGKAARALAKNGVESGFITDGSASCLAWRGDECAVLVPPVIKGVADVTGTGDAFAAQAFLCLERGTPLSEALSLSTAAAQITLRSSFSAAPDLSTAAVIKAASALNPETRSL